MWDAPMPDGLSQIWTIFEANTEDDLAYWSAAKGECGEVGEVVDTDDEATLEDNAWVPQPSDSVAPCIASSIEETDIFHRPVELACGSLPSTVPSADSRAFFPNTLNGWS